MMILKITKKSSFQYQWDAYSSVAMFIYMEICLCIKVCGVTLYAA